MPRSNKIKPTTFTVLIEDIKIPKKLVAAIESDIQAVISKHLLQDCGTTGYASIRNLSKIFPQTFPDITAGLYVSSINNSQLKKINQKLWKG